MTEMLLIIINAKPNDYLNGALMSILLVFEELTSSDTAQSKIFESPLII